MIPFMVSYILVFMKNDTVLTTVGVSVIFVESQYHLICSKYCLAGIIFSLQWFSFRVEIIISPITGYMDHVTPAVELASVGSPGMKK